MRLEAVLSRPATIRLVAALSRGMPAKSGHVLARSTARILGRLQPEVYRIVRANLCQVLGPAASAEELEDKTRRVFYHYVLGYFDFFRLLPLPREQLQPLVEVPEALQALVHSERVKGKGLVLALPHTGNFDLVGRVLSFYVPSMQVIALPNPHPGFQSMNELRRQTGAQVTPLGPAALRQALKTLRAGGVVATGVDRPLSALDEPVSFFGRPAHMPSGHVRLALKTGALLAVVACAYRPQDARYMVDMEPPLEMIRTGDEEEVRLNMRRVLDVMERLVRRWSDQWMMFVPVWPELLEE
jgi:lauroyl/myristoyl acyltransferase